MDADLNPVERLLAIEAIKTLRARYCRFLDTKDWDGLRTTLSPDIRLDLPSLREQGGLRGIEAFIDLVTQWFAVAPSLHANSLPEIDILSSCDAVGIWAQEHFLPARYRPTIHHGHGYGYSHDRYECVDGRWRIASITLVPRFELE